MGAAAAFSQTPTGRGPFRAGAAASNVTPWLGLSINGNMQDVTVSHVHDELHARCLVLDDGTNRLALAVVDSCMLPREVIDQAKARFVRSTGFNPSNILISATHTHSAPAAVGIFQSDPDPDYQEFLTVRIADGLRRAFNNLAPAKIGWGVGVVSNQVFNRRWKMKPEVVLNDPFGGTNDLVKMNPGVGNPGLLEPAGPIDPEVWFVYAISTNGRPIALLANYSLHYCGGTGPGHVSADYFGMFARILEKQLDPSEEGPPFVAIMSNGTSGDINNIDFRGGSRPRSGPYAQMRVVAEAVAAEVSSKLPSLALRDQAPLQSRQREIELAVRKPSKADLEKARQTIAGAKSDKLQTQSEIYSRETLLLETYPEKVRVVVQGWQIGELRIAAIPCEVFVEIGLGLKKKFAPAFTISLANGYHGYLPTAAQHRLGGYETWRARSSFLEVDAADKIVSTLEELFR